jgi:coenzyme F420-0:L-glutamate ligase / coenzyme F420-1:gamma-L-glutamate ligase
MGLVALRAIAGLPEIGPGEDLARLIAGALGETPLGAGSVVSIAHTVVSKAEGSVVKLSGVTPEQRALDLATEMDRDPRLIQVVLDESAEILRAERGVLICRTAHGFVCANAGVDLSNAGRAEPGELAVLLPRDPDGSARAIRRALAELTGCSPAVMITDSFGRAWRHGQVDVAIGLAGLAPLDDWRGRADADGLELRATWLAVADAAAAASDLARAKDSREPVVVIDGLDRFVSVSDGPGAISLLRSLAEDMFR